MKGGIFWFRDRAEFDAILGGYADFVTIHADRFLLPLKESVRFRAEIAGAGEKDTALASYLCELYRLTGEERYLLGAKEQLAGLELFQGLQPDYHLNEVAIRHWDGYWFGKRRLYGDTFPHYWSALTGIAFYHAQFLPGMEACGERVQNMLRGTLSLFREDGSASCAMVYPMSVNGVKAHFYDPWANDQDWGLYFLLRYGEET